MHIWGLDGADVGLANLNSALTVFDAVVDARAGAVDGPVYPNVTDALNDNHRTILVREGVYPGFTLYDDNVTIVGVRRPIIVGTSVVSGVRFSSYITIYADGAHFSGLGVNATANSYGFRVSDGSGHIIEKCAVAGVAIGGGTAFNINAPLANSIFRDNEITNIANGFLVQPGAYDSVRGITVERNYIHDTGGTAIGVMDSTGEDNQAFRTTMVFNNTILRAAQVWGDSIAVEEAAGAMIIGNYCESGGSDNNTGAHGVYANYDMGNPTIRTMIMGNKLMYNRGYGICLTSTSSRTGVVGNISTGNSSGNFANCGSCPGMDDSQYGSNVGN